MLEVSTRWGVGILDARMREAELLGLLETRGLMGLGIFETGRWTSMGGAESCSGREGSR